MNILYACDDKYAPLCGISMTSLFESNKDMDEIIVYLLAHKLSDENIDKMRETAKRYCRSIVFCDAQKIDAFLETQNLPRWKDSYAPYYRLFAARALSEGVHKVLYLDSDTIVVSSLKELQNKALDAGKCIAMVLNSRTSKADKVAVGMGENDPYFITGAEYIDLVRWKQHNCESRIVEELKNPQYPLRCPDVEVLNRIFTTESQPLHPRYNYYISATPLLFDKLHSLFSSKKRVVWSSREFKQAKKYPAIIHCVDQEMYGAVWKTNNVHPFCRIWEKYRSISLWNDFVVEEVRVKKVYLRILRKIFPMRVYESIDYVYQNMKRSYK